MNLAKKFTNLLQIYKGDFVLRVQKLPKFIIESEIRVRESVENAPLRAIFTSGAKAPKAVIASLDEIKAWRLCERPTRASANPHSKKL